MGAGHTKFVSYEEEYACSLSFGRVYYMTRGVRIGCMGFW
jgi:hypothetical protein